MEVESGDDNVYYTEFFQYKDGCLYCEDVPVQDVKTFLEENGANPSGRFFVYSQAQLVANITTYKNALASLDRKIVLNYAMKANMSPSLLEVIRNNGCSVTLVSGFELQLALRVGFEPSTMVLNGNGKQEWEIELAVRHGCLLNIDSLFNLEQTTQVCIKLNKEARVLLRLNPDIHANVHRHNATAGSNSKFGIAAGDLDIVIQRLKDSTYLTCVGIHCHLGSTIADLHVFRTSAEATMRTFRDLKERGLTGLYCLNLGGGLAIPYAKHADKTRQNTCADVQHTVPTPAELVKTIDDVIADDDVTLILEPGRSLVGNVGVLISTVLGVKRGVAKNYIVVDAAMTDVIRPALYDAYHHIDVVTKAMSDPDRACFDIVGPVCESGDFLGRDRFLETPQTGSLLAMFDVGAYCASMASNYNMRARPAEVLVKGANLKLVRRPDTLESILAPYNIQTDVQTVNEQNRQKN